MINKTEEEFNFIEEDEEAAYQEILKEERIAEEFAQRYLCHFSPLAYRLGKTNYYDPTQQSRCHFETQQGGFPVTYSIPAGNQQAIVATVYCEDQDGVETHVNFDISSLMESILEYHLSKSLYKIGSISPLNNMSEFIKSQDYLR
jgi:hypothetical protein